MGPTPRFDLASLRAGLQGRKHREPDFHDLRHAATFRLFEKDLNPMQAAAITGHETQLMLKRYTHLRAENLAPLLTLARRPRVRAFMICP